jgi:hypothetical protein
MTPFRRSVPCLGLLLFAPAFAGAQTPEMIAEVEAHLHALRTAGPLVLPGPAATVANEEAAIAALVAKIDKHLDVFWARNQIKPAKPASDAEFLRRVSLDLLGRVPSVAEVRQFTAGTDPKKRAKKVAELLGKAGFVNHFATVLRQQWLPQTQDNPQFQFIGPQFENWLRTRFRENAGMDKIVREVLTAPTLFARGRGAQPANVDPNNTAFVFNQVHEFKPENVAASASRLFMGVKMECAQCHDHPFAAISREQFWETAAFFAELQPAIANVSDPKIKREIRIDDPDPRKVKTVPARFFDDTEPQWQDAISPRQTFAEWLTAPKNPYFGRIMAQRLWAHFFGLGFLDPIDEPGGENPELIPELVTDLANAYAASGFDTRFLVKAVTRTRAYQLSSRLSDKSQEGPRTFARMNVKAMTAEQLYDSLAQATGYSDPTDANPQQRRFAGARREFLTKFASTEKITERQTSILQALTLMNGKFVNDQTNLERSHFLAAIADAPFMDVSGKVEALFMATLGRAPTPSEANQYAGYVRAGGAANDEKKALADVFWALLNSSEFILNH